MARTLALTVALVAGCATTTDAPPTPTTVAPTTPLPPTTVAPTTVAVATTVPPTTTTVAPVVPHPPSTTVAPPDPHPPSQTARVSWYGNESGSRTANGEAFTGDDLTFAHRTMAFGALVRFCHAGACVVARCNDRGPAAWTGKTFDLSRAAFAAIAPLGRGVITVEWSAA